MSILSIKTINCLRKNSGKSWGKIQEKTPGKKSGKIIGKKSRKKSGKNENAGKESKQLTIA